MSKEMKKDEKKKGNIFTNAGFITLLIVGFLVIGAFGYYFLDNPDWIDAFYASASILTGVGAIDAPKSREAKLFSIVFTLATNLLLLFIIGYVVQFYIDQSK